MYYVSFLSLSTTFNDSICAFSFDSRQKRTPVIAAPGPTTGIATVYHAKMASKSLMEPANHKEARIVDPKANVASHCNKSLAANSALVVAGSSIEIEGRNNALRALMSLVWSEGHVAAAWVDDAMTNMAACIICMVT